MKFSSKALLVRNTACAVVNGAITLILLLIAPLGLAAVVTNTFLVTLSTFFVCTVADKVVVWLLPSSKSQLAFRQGIPFNSENNQQKFNQSQSSRGELKEGDD